MPAATTFVVPVKITKDHGKFGTKAFIDVPKIVSGNGSLTGFKAKIKKTWSVKGKKQSLLNAGCPKGKRKVHSKGKARCVAKAKKSKHNGKAGKRAASKTGRASR